MSRLFVSAVVLVGLVTLTVPPSASGITHDKLTYLTFNVPVQIPGATLKPGTYRFHLTNPDTSRNVLQVLSGDGAIVYAKFNTIPDSRIKATTEAAVTFMETPAGVPPAVRSLFYGFEYGGYEFVYPKGGPNMVPEPLPPFEVTYTALPAPVAAVPAAAAPEVAAAEPVPVEPVAEPAAEELAAAPAEIPRTASPLPFFAVGGFGSLLASLALYLRRRQVG